MTEWMEADDFTLTNAARLDAVKFWDLELPMYFAGSFVWRIYSNSPNNTPGTLLASGTSDKLSHIPTGHASGPYQEYVNTFDFNSVVLPAGTYWLGLHNGPLNNFGAGNVYWETTSNTGPRASHAARGPLYQAWLTNASPEVTSEFAFNLDGVPLPRITDLNLNGGTARISFTTTAGEQYRVEYKNVLNGGSWTTLPGADAVIGTGGVMQISDPDPNVRTLPRRFYRVVLAPAAGKSGATWRRIAGRQFAQSLFGVLVRSELDHYSPR